MPKFFCENKKTSEVYETYKQTLIGAIMSKDTRLTELQASNLLLDSSIDNPVDLDDEFCWVE